MRCYLITATNPKTNKVIAKRLASTSAAAKTVRDELMESKSLRKKDITIEPHEAPTPKPELLSYLNELYAMQDAEETEGDE